MTLPALRVLALSLVEGLALQAAPPDAPRPPKEAAKHFEMPEGFRALLFAGEPDVVQPIGITTDDRGRLWVVETQTYPTWITDGKPGHDRILIFEDSDGDGSFDSRKVFAGNLANLSGIEVGFGGAWLTAAPNLLFLPDRNGDDVADGPPEVVLDGWDLKAKHNVINGPKWGPDGWLYGMNGILSNSRVGKPGTPPEERVFMNCGVWRFHPVTRAFEVVAHGTTNPWGLDYDDWGRMFITNCVIKHLWTVVPGARFQRMFGQDTNPHAYGLMESPADHIHWATGTAWTDSRGGKGAHDGAGGGHAHVGALVYLGDNWPDAYRNTLFTHNLHGNRISNDLLEPKGSGMLARHGRDFLHANDPWFRGLELVCGPDGGVFITDWSDTGECHDYDHCDRSNGRIYKITYGKATPQHPDLAAASDEALVKLQLHKNDWWVRHARRLLQERAAAGKLAPTTVPALAAILRENPDATRKLRALWTLHAAGALDEKLLLELLGHADPHVRGWAVRLSVDTCKPTEALASRLVDLAATEPAAPVRLELASAVQRVPPAFQWPLAERLAARVEDPEDVNLPLLLWYGLEPLVAADKDRAVTLLPKVKIPAVRQFLTRRIAALSK